ncbi:MAG: hypothetical protein NDI61_00725 [Bdellovibrionaceae bacterium]|nr:hypothetical protein [Pseudobdellovibrionaceae bacterium]
MRSARLASRHAAAATALGLPSSAPLSREFIEWQILGISVATDLDTDASSIQAQGVPILCQDVPPISPDPQR